MVTIHSHHLRMVVSFMLLMGKWLFSFTVLQFCALWWLTFILKVCVDCVSNIHILMSNTMMVRFSLQISIFTLTLPFSILTLATLNSLGSSKDAYVHSIAPSLMLMLTLFDWGPFDPTLLRLFGTVFFYCSLLIFVRFGSNFWGKNFEKVYKYIPKLKNMFILKWQKYSKLYRNIFFSFCLFSSSYNSMRFFSNLVYYFILFRFLLSS